MTVPEGHVWVEGENAMNSADSREYGPIPIALIEGYVLGKVGLVALYNVNYSFPFIMSWIQISNFQFSSIPSRFHTDIVEMQKNDAIEAISYDL